MSSSSPTRTVYLVTGANRGIGFALTAHILRNNPTAFVYAGVRDPSSASSLQELAKAHPGGLAILKYISADVENNAAVVKAIKDKHGKVDTVIANAAICEAHTLVLEAPIVELESHIKINLYGPIILFQAIHELLRKSTTPRFIPITSLTGSIDGLMITIPTQGSYGISKAALNYATRKIHFENEWLITFSLSPGVVATETFKESTAILSAKSEMIKGWLASTVVPRPAEAAKNLLNIIDNSTREKEGGEFIDIDGSKAKW